MAKRNIKKHGGTASAAAANKASMRKRAKARHKASQAKKRARSRRRRSRGRGRRRCDIFLKYNISPLTNMNLIRDDLAEVAYFVKEIQK